MDEDRPVLIGPGRVVRLPVGYFFFGAAVVLAAAFGGYLVGYQVRDRSAEAEKRRLVSEGMILPADPLASETRSGTPVAGTNERPVRTGTTGGSQTGTQPERPRTQDRAPQGGTTGGTTAGTGGAGTTGTGSTLPPGVVLVQQGERGPWEPGLNYFIIASYGQENALELAEFLAGNGVPVVVTRLRGSPLWSVVSQQGFTRDPMRADGEIGAYRARLERLGREFGALGGWRRPSFSDMYGMRLLSP